MIMSTIITGAILILSTVGILFFFIFINTQKNKKRRKALLNTFNQAGADKGLTFSSQEVLTEKIIGLDGLHHKLLIFEFNNSNTIIHINLDDVKNCSFKKEYIHVNFGNEKKADIERQLGSIGLEFSFKNSSEPFFLSFYNDNTNSIYDMADLETKVKNWEIMLSKMISKDIKVRA